MSNSLLCYLAEALSQADHVFVESSSEALAIEELLKQNLTETEWLELAQSWASQSAERLSMIPPVLYLVSAADDTRVRFFAPRNWLLLPENRLHSLRGLYEIDLELRRLWQKRSGPEAWKEWKARTAAELLHPAQIDAHAYGLNHMSTWNWQPAYEDSDFERAVLQGVSQQRTQEARQEAEQLLVDLRESVLEAIEHHPAKTPCKLVQRTLMGIPVYESITLEPETRDTDINDSEIQPENDSAETKQTTSHTDQPDSIIYASPWWVRPESDSFALVHEPRIHEIKAHPHTSMAEVRPPYATWGQENQNNAETPLHPAALMLDEAEEAIPEVKAESSLWMRPEEMQSAVVDRNAMVPVWKQTEAAPKVQPTKPRSEWHLEDLPPYPYGDVARIYSGPLNAMEAVGADENPSSLPFQPVQAYMSDPEQYMPSNTLSKPAEIEKETPAESAEMVPEGAPDEKPVPAEAETGSDEPAFTSQTTIKNASEEADQPVLQTTNIQTVPVSIPFTENESSAITPEQLALAEPEEKPAAPATSVTEQTAEIRPESASETAASQTETIPVKVAEEFSSEKDQAEQAISTNEKEAIGETALWRQKPEVVLQPEIHKEWHVEDLPPYPYGDVARIVSGPGVPREEMTENQPERPKGSSMQITRTELPFQPVQRLMVDASYYTHPEQNGQPLAAGKVEVQPQDEPWRHIQVAKKPLPGAAQEQPAEEIEATPVQIHWDGPLPPFPTGNALQIKSGPVNQAKQPTETKTELAPFETGRISVDPIWYTHPERQGKPLAAGPLPEKNPEQGQEPWRLAGHVETKVVQPASQKPEKLTFQLPADLILPAYPTGSALVIQSGPVMRLLTQNEDQKSGFETGRILVDSIWYTHPETMGQPLASFTSQPDADTWLEAKLPLKLVHLFSQPEKNIPWPRPLEWLPETRSAAPQESSPLVSELLQVLDKTPEKSGTTAFPASLQAYNRLSKNTTELFLSLEEAMTLVGLSRQCFEKETSYCFN